MNIITISIIVGLLGFEIVCQKPFEPSNLIKDGDCTKLEEKNFLYRKVVEKVAIPFVKRKALVEYFGTEHISCVLVNNLLDGDIDFVNQIVWISSGGHNEEFVMIRMESDIGHQLKYEVLIYGEKNKTISN